MLGRHATVHGSRCRTANYLEEEADPRARAAYGTNYDRLVALKRKCTDPGNVFRINHNIWPITP